MTLRVFSFGGGVQSTAALVLASRRAIDVDAFVFADVSGGLDDCEPYTTEYVRQYSQPFATNHGIRFEWVRRVKRDGEPESLFDRMMRANRGFVIPVHLADNGGPMRRQCTEDFKIKPVAKWSKANGATLANPAIHLLGITVEEAHRMNNGPTGFDWVSKREYPLIDLRLTRRDCHSIIASADLPPVEKSSCDFCPYHSTAMWHRIKRERPERWKQAVELEAHLNAKCSRSGYKPITLSDSGVMLKDWPDQAAFDFDALETTEGCESGYCFT